MKYSRPRGTRDILGNDMEVWKRVEKQLAAIMEGYGYHEIRTPIFEESDLFIRSVGETSDIVSKEMYTFSDRKGRSLTLRPENTAPVMRAYLENGLQREGGITKFYYIGPMFRYDKPQAGRYRQFHQIGAEAIGSSNPVVDAEIIDISIRLHREIGLDSLTVRLNSVGCLECRNSFLGILRKELELHRDQLCEDCKIRAEANPLRVLDCKNCVDLRVELPVITDYICDRCREHFDTLTGILQGMNIDYELDPYLVRGLDYYTRTAYEIIHSELGAQNALCGGGRYDGLAEELGGGSIPAVGFSAGLERMVEVLDQSRLRSGTGPVRVYFVVFNSACSVPAMLMAGELRENGVESSVDLSLRNVKKQLRTASREGYDYAVFMGDNELEAKEAVVKDLKQGTQENVSFERISEYFDKEGVEEVD
ncbi:MAG: histidine--tRNA ligase [Candidatus Latescibacteria bacterium]|nr:histidine--tRNA ligase [bacterium]MBD3424804.1 histidine--tRNA ligase [Candidatus Latescibacterota bacterium]